MGKTSYDVSYKIYHNDRLKPVLFRGRKSHPLYVRVTYDRRSVFFKSYYFALFGQKKYDPVAPTLGQIERLESRVIDYIIARNADSFSLELLLTEYKVYSVDVLDALEKPFLEWLGGCLSAARLPALGACIANGGAEVLATRLWDDLKVGLQPDFVRRIEEQAARTAQPYYWLSRYVRNRNRKGPFCLPYHQLVEEKDQVWIEFFSDSSVGDVGQLIRTVNGIISGARPKG